MPKRDSDAPPVGWKWVREELDKKADLNWAKSELKSLRKDENETRRIALSGKKTAETPHECHQDEAIDEIMKTIDGWKTVKLGAVISVVVLIAAGLAQFFALKAKADENGEAVVQVQDSIDGIEGDVENTAKAVKDHLDWTEKQQKRADKDEEKKLKAISDAVKIAIEESNTKKKR